MRKSRFEIKYIFPLEKLGELNAYVRPYMDLDQYSTSNGQTGFYHVRSIYFDSRSFDFYRCHLEGYPDRRKIRLRKYAYQEKEFYFLEVKNKVFLSTRKYRLKLEDDLMKNGTDYKEFCESFIERYQNNHIAEMINFDLLTLRIVPVLYVAYKRIAFSSKYEHDVRLTVDYDIETSKALESLCFGHKLEPHKISPSSVGVLEFKCNRTIPSWLQDILRSFCLTRTAFSKYQKGMESVYNLY